MAVNDSTLKWYLHFIKSSFDVKFGVEDLKLLISVYPSQLFGVFVCRFTKTEQVYIYEYHLQNYQTSLITGLIPNGLKIKKSPAITPVSENFNTKWNEVLYNAEKNLVELLLYESSKVIAKIQVELDLEVRKIDPENYSHN